MDQNLDGELSLLDVNSEEQINMDKSPQAPAFSPLTPSKLKFHDAANTSRCAHGSKQRTKYR